jgi:NADH-quinone oxidoreductase subunit M
MRGWAGLIGVFIPFLVLLVASCGPVRGRALRVFSLLTNLVSWLCFVFLASGFYLGAKPALITSPFSMTASPWSVDLFLSWDYQSAVLSLAVSSVVVCFHFLARKTLEGSRASIAGLSSYLGCLLGALGSGHLFLFSIFFAGSLVPRFVFAGVDGRERTIEAIKETAFLGIVALFCLLTVVLVFSDPFKQHLPEWFRLAGAKYEVLPGSIGFSLLLVAAAIGAGLFPFHGNTRKNYGFDSMERAVPLVLQSLFGFAVLFRFSVGLFSTELKLFSPYLLGFFSIGLAYCAVGFMGSKRARDRIFWLQQVMNCLVAIGFFSLSRKGWHGAAVLLFFQALAVPFYLIVLSCHERRENLLMPRIVDFPLLSLSTVAAVLFTLFLPLSVGFYGVLLVVWSLVAQPSWYLPFVLVSLPIIALAGMNSMFFFMGERDTQGSGSCDLTYEEVLAILPVGALLLLLGLLPRLLMDPMGVSVAALLSGLGISV